MQRNGLEGLIAGVAALVPGPALAGAWIAPEGGQEILTVAYGETATQEFSQTDLYLELPVHERWSIVAHPRYETSTGSEEGWRADAELGAKAALLVRPGAAASVQAAMLWRSDPEAGCDASGGEIRALGGLSRGLGEGSGFINAEAALRLFGGGDCQRQRFELTAGYRPSERWLAISQAYVDADPEGEAIVRAQTSLVRFFGAHGVQLGVRVRLDGEEREPALVLGWWDAVRP
jgi:hypothetical protein